MMPLLLGVVSDRTGYPAEMLNPDMELESDLGIDSIKRVEILSAMQDLVPDLPDVELDVMAGLATLGQIVDYLTDRLTTAHPQQRRRQRRRSITTTEPPSGTPTSEMMPLLLGVVSDRTGYPAEMLNPDMELESDLGIDSIKRVEILSAMQDLVPDLPDVELDVMAGLATLGQIVDYLTDRLTTDATDGRRQRTITSSTGSRRRAAPSVGSWCGHGRRRPRVTRPRSCSTARS